MNEMNLIPQNDYVNACNAVREKGGSVSQNIKSGELAQAIRNIPTTGGTGYILPGVTRIKTTQIVPQDGNTAELTLSDTDNMIGFIFYMTSVPKLGNIAAAFMWIGTPMSNSVAYETNAMGVTNEGNPINADAGFVTCFQKKIKFVNITFDPKPLQQGATYQLIQLYNV